MTDMVNRHSNEIDMLHGPLYKKMLVFMVPLILSSALQLLFNAADIIVVGRYAGGNSLAAVGATGPAVALIVNFIIGFTVGINYCVARHIAAGSEERVSADVHTAVCISLLAGIITGAAGAALSYRLLSLMNTPNDIIDRASLYLSIYFAGLPGIAVYNAGASVIRSWGDTKSPMVYLTLAGLLNVFLNLVFVIALHLDVAGVAMATIISNYVSCLLILGSLMRKDARIRLEIRKLRINRKSLKEIANAGIPSSIQISTFGITNLLIQSAVNSLGAVTIAATAAAINIENFLYIIGSACSTAVLTFMSQNYGARKFSRLDTSLRTGTWLGVIMYTAGAVIVYIFREQLMGLYTSEPDIIATGCLRLTLLLPTVWMDALMNTYSAALRCLGHSGDGLIISLLTICGFRVVWLMTVFPAVGTYTVIILAWPLSWVLNIIINFFYYRKIRSRLPVCDTFDAL